MRRKINNQGFTLVEVLCVVVILSLLVVFAVPNFIRVLNSNKDSISDIQEKMIIEASKMYYEDCLHPIDENKLNCAIKTENDKTIISLNDLVKNEYIDQIKVNDKVCEGNIIKENNNYSVELDC